MALIVQLCFDLSAEKVDITAVLTVVAADDRGLSRAALGLYLAGILILGIYIQRLIALNVSPGAC